MRWGRGASEAKSGLRAKGLTECPSDSAQKRIKSVERTAGPSKLSRHSLQAQIGFRAELRGILRREEYLLCCACCLMGFVVF